MSDTATTFHQLHLFFIDADDGAIRVGRTIHADDKAVGQRGNLVIVADTGHGASLRNNVLEMVHQVEELLCAHRVRILGFDACHFVGDTPMHVGW